LAKEKIIFYQDNAPAHKIVLAMGKLRNLHYELLEHPPYSPDLAPSDIYPFPKLKLFHVGQRFFRIERRLQLQKGILQTLRRTTTGAG
jgi:histone-lysine N-methyltransferase SETMAR